MNTKDNSNTQKQRSRSKGFRKAMKVVRRVHMYLGLLLVPWVVLFGVSGFLFNHTSTFWGGNTETIASIVSGSSELIDVDVTMQYILEQINADSDSTYSLAASPWLTGDLKLAGRGENGNITLAIDLADGSAEVTARTNSTPEQEKPNFHEKKIQTNIQSIDTIADQYKTILTDSNIALKGKLAPPARGANAEIRFLLSDPEGRHWRGSYNIATSTLSGVADDANSGYNFYSTVTRLHKTHLYPDTIGAKWIWTLIGDITAISMVVWGLSGLIMWWQIQPTRALGTIAIFIAAIVSFLIFSGTLADYTHNPVQIQGK